MRRIYRTSFVTILAVASSCAVLGCDKARATSSSGPSDPAPGATTAAANSTDVSGAWVCLFSNTSGSAITETLIFAPDGSVAKVSATGVDAARNRYQRSGSGSLKNGEWNVTFNWNNGATPTWIRVKPATNGKTMSGRRGKFDDKKYEGDYNCTRT